MPGRALHCGAKREDQAGKRRLSADPQPEEEEIKEIGQLRINQADFIFEKNERFRENYIIGQSLGSGKAPQNNGVAGAFGEVRKCQNKRTQAIRAVKILRKDQLDEKDIERFIHEIEILRKLVRKLGVSQAQDHPNILRLYEFY